MCNVSLVKGKASRLGIYRNTADNRLGKTGDNSVIHRPINEFLGFC